MAKNYDNIVNGIRKKINSLKDEIKKTSSDEKRELLIAQVKEREYSLLKIQEEIEGRVLKPKYGDGRFASKDYSFALDMLRVLYYDYFGIDPEITKIEKQDFEYMFLDPTLPIMVDVFKVSDKYQSFILMLENPCAYDQYQSCSSWDISIKIPFEVLVDKKHEQYLKYLLDLVKLYSGKDINLILFENYNKKGSLSYISFEEEILNSKEAGFEFDINQKYMDFFDRLCDNMWFYIVYENISNGNASPEAIEYVRNNYINHFSNDFLADLISNNIVSSLKEIKSQRDDISTKVKKLIKIDNK